MGREILQVVMLISNGVGTENTLANDSLLQKKRNHRKKTKKNDAQNHKERTVFAVLFSTKEKKKNAKHKALKAQLD